MKIYRITTGMGVRLVAMAAVAIAFVQFSNSTFGDQSRWKGGGFGMYTEPHPTNRHVWAVLTDTAGESHAVQLWPRIDALRAQLTDGTQKAADLLQPAIGDAYRLATSADAGRMDRIAETVTNVPWRVGPDGAPRLSGEIPFEIAEVEIAVYEKRLDIAGRRIAAHHILGGEAPR